MKLNKSQIILIVAALVLALITLAIVFDFGGGSKVDHIVKIGEIDKDSIVVDDGTYLYYTNSDGDVMCVDPYNTENTHVWVEDMEVLDVNGTHMMLRYKGEIVILDKEEKSVVEHYSIASDDIQFTSDSVYYLDKDTKYVMRILRGTDEVSTLLPFEVNQLLTYEDNILYVKNEKKTGINSLDVSKATITFYAYDKTVSDFYVTGDGFVYYTVSGKGNRLNYVNTLSGDEGPTDHKFKDVAALKGAFFYKDKTLGGKYVLKMDKEELY